MYVVLCMLLYYAIIMYVCMYACCCNLLLSVCCMYHVCSCCCQLAVYLVSKALELFSYINLFSVLQVLAKLLFAILCCKQTNNNIVDNSLTKETTKFFNSVHFNSFLF